MEGLEISIVSFSEMLNHTVSSRFDAEFFKKEYLIDDKSIAKNGFDKLVAVTSKINVGFVGSMVEHYRKDGCTLLQTKNIDKFFISDNDTIKVTYEFHNELKKSQIKYEDILIARSGSFGKASIYLENEIINSSDIIIVKANGAISPYYLVSFLNSKFGVNQMIRFSSGGLQGHVNLTILEELEVPKLDEKFQFSIEEVIKKAYECRLKSKKTYKKAEGLLLQEIDLQDFEPSKEPVNIKSFSDSFGASGRLDAEYYQPKYEVIENAVKSYSNGYNTFNKLITNSSTGYTYKSDTYCDEGIPLIRINNISNGNLDLSNATNIPFKDFHLSEKDIALENDILISMSGTIGSSCKIPEGVKAVVNQRIMRISPKNINPDILPLIINSVIGQYQLARVGTGGVQTNISANDIKEILIPNYDLNKQQQIAELVEQSFKLKKQSEQLLVVAKTAVEMAIEQNEAVALDFIAKNAVL